VVSTGDSMNHAEFLNTLADLSLDAPSFEIALAALKLQTLINTHIENEKLTPAEVFEKFIA
jgi:hypothetical protein